MFNQKEYLKEYYQKNKEKYAERSKIWSKKNPEFGKLYNKQYRKKYRERLNEYARKRYNKEVHRLHNKKCLTCGILFETNLKNQKYCGSIKRKIGCSYRQVIINQKKYQKNYNKNLRVLKYNITLKEYKELFLKQNNLCAICCSLNKNRELSIDHDHKTGKVRGLLCHKCNVGLGMFNDNTNLMKKAILYLDK